MLRFLRAGIRGLSRRRFAWPTTLTAAAVVAHGLA